MKQLGFLVHTEKCLGCRSCEFSCRNEHGHGDTFRRKIHSFHEDSEKKGHNFYHFSMSCNHCETPACMSSCPTRAIVKKPNGIVLIEKSKCTGCSFCVSACPFGAITLNSITAKADKCDMCYERQIQGETTICVSSCPVHAIEIIDIYDPKNTGYDKAVLGFDMKKLTQPSIRFNNKKENVQQFWSRQ